MTHPDSSYPLSTVPAEQRDELEASLAAAAASRERQLAELPPTYGDLVATAHRDSVARILAEIRSAHARLTTGSFGRCARCRDAIPVARLELRPWASLCVGCVRLVQS
jgi:DnaK suppressor protein